MFQFQYIMNAKRVFIAVNLPSEIKKSLEKALEKIKPLFGPEARFLSPDNWHLTLEFLAYQDDDSVSRIAQALEAISQEFTQPEVLFEKIVYGPVGKSPRMIWLMSDRETSARLNKIKNALEEELHHQGVRFRQEHRAFQAHLTLARFEETIKGALPPLDIPFDREFEAQSIDLMESHLKRSGAEYDILGQFDFGGSQG